MPPTRRRYLAAAAGAIAIAGCQSGPNDSTTTTDEGDNGGGAPNTATPTTDSGGGATAVAVREHPDFGEVLVDGEGLTLYMFDSDTQDSGESTCTDGCLSAWPPLVADGEPIAGDGVNATLSTFERGDGDTQVAANGWPLYYYAQDSSPGDVTGQGANDVWWILTPAGEPIRETATATASGATDGSGPGY